MTISCRCPRCDALCAFYDKNAGRKARCRSCGQIFIIPGEDGAKPEKVKIKVEEGQPEPGYWRAVFLENWKVFFKRESITPLVFIATLVMARFLLVRSCFANIRPSLNIFFWVEYTLRCAYLACLFTVSWGWFLGYYLNVIYETAHGVDRLPEVYLGTAVLFWWNIVKPFLIFVVTLIIVLLPFLLLWVALSSKGAGYTLRNIWIAELGWVSVLQVLFVAGLFVFPMAILIMGVTEDFTTLRPDWLLRPIFKAPGAYLVLVSLVLVASLLELNAPPLVAMSGETAVSIAVRLAGNFGIHLVTIFSMRSIGLFCRHYGCYIQW